MSRGLLGTRRLLERAGRKAAITTADIDTEGGRLNPDQANRFIDYVVDQSVMFKDGIRVVRMRADRADLDKIAVGTRIIRKATEGTDPGAPVGVTVSKRSLTATEIILPVDVTFSFFEDNIEEENFESHLMQLMGTQLSNDLEDLAIVGDTGSGDPFIQIEDGWLDLLKTAADKRFDTNAGDDFRGTIWRGMLATMPDKFKANKTALRYYTSVTNEEKYRFQLGQRQTDGGDAFLLQGNTGRYDGILVVGVPYMPNTDHLLTIPDNLAFGIHRVITLGIFKNERKRVYEYTWTMRIDYQIVETSAAVIAYDF
jgi:hypothetical protein